MGVFKAGRYQPDGYWYVSLVGSDMGNGPLRTGPYPHIGAATEAAIRLNLTWRKTLAGGYGASTTKGSIPYRVGDLAE